MREACMATLKLRAIGNSVGVVLPKELLSRLRVGEGDTLQVVETPDGLRLLRSNPEFERQMEVAREVMRRRRAVLRELAK
jgi:putative addiction module antidote